MSEHGAHDSRTLETGDTVHLIKHPNSKTWRINSYDWSWWVEGPILMTARVFPNMVDWDNKEFESPADAYEFVENQIKSKAVPGNLDH
jgi:hypothetical protein